jgi:hypothetical protein
MSEQGPTSIDDVKKQISSGLDSIGNAPVGAFQEAMEDVGNARRAMLEKIDEVRALGQQAIEALGRAYAISAEMHSNHESGRGAIVGATEGSSRALVTDDLDSAMAGSDAAIEDMQTDLGVVVDSVTNIENAMNAADNELGVWSGAEEVTISHSERFAASVEKTKERGEEFINGM